MDIILPVPEGTAVKSMSGELLAGPDGCRRALWRPREGAVVSKNAALASKARKAPASLLGEPGEERDVILELKSVADVLWASRRR